LYLATLPLVLRLDRIVGQSFENTLIENLNLNIIASLINLTQKVWKMSNTESLEDVLEEIKDKEKVEDNDDYDAL
jgi:hypothetical protein